MTDATNRTAPTMPSDSANAVVNASPVGQSIETLTNRTAVLVAATAILT